MVAVWAEEMKRCVHQYIRQWERQALFARAKVPVVLRNRVHAVVEGCRSRCPLSSSLLLFFGAVSDLQCEAMAYSRAAIGWPGYEEAPAGSRHRLVKSNSLSAGFVCWAKTAPAGHLVTL